MSIKVEVAGERVKLSFARQLLVFHIDEAPELVHQLQTIIRAHTIQQQDQPNA